MMIYIRFLFETVDGIHSTPFASAVTRTWKDFRVCDISFWSMRSSCQCQFAFFYDNRRATTSGFQSRQETQVVLCQRRNDLCRLYKTFDW
jgi:hypothetical protein